MSDDIEIFVSADTLDLVSEKSLLNIDCEKQEQLQVLSLAGDCYTIIMAKQFEIEMAIPCSQRKFRNALLYECYIEGYGEWKFRSDYCSRSLHWRSTIGKGRELLYTCCSDCPGETEKPTLLCPEEGRYYVTMIAWMPGSKQHVEAGRVIELHCNQ
jgi:hypothetical protein